MNTLCFINEYRVMKMIDYIVSWLDNQSCRLNFILSFNLLSSRSMPFLYLKQLPFNCQTTKIMWIIIDSTIQTNLINSTFLSKIQRIRRSKQMLIISINCNSITDPWTYPLFFILFQLSLETLLIFQPI